MNYNESPLNPNEEFFKNQLWEDRKGLAHTTGKNKRFYSPISPCKPIPMQFNIGHSGEKQRPVVLGDPNNHLLEIMNGEFRRISP